MDTTTRLSPLAQSMLFLVTFSEDSLGESNDSEFGHNVLIAYRFAIPFLAATTMGLSALALEGNPVFPTYPSRIPDADVSAGLVLPDAAVALLGKGGAAATLLIVFFAVTSALSSECRSRISSGSMPQS